jgi:antibiotic biosynthesis monooxygenase (ABM) superfamily enzyme
MTTSKESIAEPVTEVYMWAVDPADVPAFKAAMHAVHRMAALFPGHMGVTTIESPADKDNFFTVLRFDTATHMAAWLNSPQRGELIKGVYKFARTINEVKAYGLETWFNIPGQSTPPPPRWKMVVVTFTGIFPLSVIFNLFVQQQFAYWPVPLRSAVFSVIAPALLTYLVMPFLTQKVFRSWLYQRS